MRSNRKIKEDKKCILNKTERRIRKEDKKGG
jgi:hypothetical protein